MTLTLIDEEVVVYMTMKQTIEDLQTALKSAKEEIFDLTWKEPTPEPEEIETLIKYDLWENSPSTLSEPVEFADAHTAWSTTEKELLQHRIFSTGIFYGHQRSFTTIRALFPNRTEAGVKSMIYLLGGTCRNGIVQPKLKGVK